MNDTTNVSLAHYSDKVFEAMSKGDDNFTRWLGVAWMAANKENADKLYSVFGSTYRRYANRAGVEVSA